MKHQPPYLWMGHRFGVWIELTSDDSHAALESVAAELFRQSHATVIEQYPLGYHDGAKEYWTLQIGRHQFMLMRLQGAGIALGAEKNERNALIQIARELGVTKRVGWRWWLWDFTRWIRDLLPQRNEG